MNTVWLKYYHPEVGVKYFGAATYEKAFNKAEQSFYNDKLLLARSNQEGLLGNIERVNR